LLKLVRLGQEVLSLPSSELLARSTIGVMEIENREDNYRSDEPGTKNEGHKRKAPAGTFL